MVKMIDVISSISVLLFLTPPDRFPHLEDPQHDRACARDTLCTARGGCNAWLRGRRRCAVCVERNWRRRRGRSADVYARVALWAFRLFGAGDAKLFLPIGLFVGWHGMLPFSFSSSSLASSHCWPCGCRCHCPSHTSPFSCASRKFGRAGRYLMASSWYSPRSSPWPCPLSDSSCSYGDPASTELPRTSPFAFTIVFSKICFSRPINSYRRQAYRAHIQCGANGLGAFRYCRESDGSREWSRFSYRRCSHAGLNCNI